MDSVEALVSEMRALPGSPVLSQSLIDRAIRNGWPAELFTEVIGLMDEDFTRPPQPLYESRTR